MLWNMQSAIYFKPTQPHTNGAFTRVRIWKKKVYDIEFCLSDIQTHTCTYIALDFAIEIGSSSKRMYAPTTFSL